MKPKRDTKHEADQLVRDLKRRTRRKFSAEEKIRIVLAGVRGEDSIRSCAVVKACTRICITAGAKSFWKPGRNG